MKKFKIFLKKYWVEMSLFFTTLIIVSSYGIDEFPILKDMGFFSYLGQELTRGYSIYSTTIFMKPPLVPIFYAFSMNLFYFLPQYLSIRVFMLIIISVFILLFYTVTLRIFNDKILSTLSVLILISFTFFMELSLSGDSKLWALFFTFLTFFLLFRGFHLLSGISASLSFLSYQPLGLFLITPLIFLFLESNKRRIKIEKCGKTLLGFFIPLILLVIYFLFYGSLIDFINCSVIYPIKYESKITTIWVLFNVLGYYCSEFFFLFLGIIGLLYALYKIIPEIIKEHSLIFFCKNKYLMSFIIPFFLLSLFMTRDFHDGIHLTIFLPLISILAALSLKKIHGYFAKIISNKTHIPKRKINKITTSILILIVCVYGFFPALQPVYPENPIIRDGKELSGKVSPTELVQELQRKFGTLNSIYLFLFHRKGEQVTIEHQLELAKIIQNNTNENEKIVTFTSPEILFLSNRRNMNPYPLFWGVDEVAEERGEIGKMKEDVIKYKPKFILTDRRSIEKFDLSEFIEKNYEETPFIYYKVYKLSANF